MDTTQKLTRSKALRLTRKMFRELAESGKPYKPEYALDWKNACPLCQYVLDQYSKPTGNYANINICELYCPLKWPKNITDNSICFGSGGLWCKWYAAKTKTRRKKLAKQISRLPHKRIK